jgi:inner membrane protein
MTGRTHDLAAFTALTVVVATQPMPQMSLATAVVALGANMLGGLVPDLDKSTSDLWNHIPAGSIIGSLIEPLMGCHRLISHSILGMVIIGFLIRQGLTVVNRVLLVDMNIVWWAVIIGYFSHLVTDTLTKEGVPWLFPIPVRIGFPPMKMLRLTTNGMLEKGLVFPGLILLNGYLIYQNYGKFLEFVKHLAR